MKKILKRLFEKILTKINTIGWKIHCYGLEHSNKIIWLIGHKIYFKTRFILTNIRFKMEILEDRAQK